jgi:hypothetical protein
MSNYGSDYGALLHAVSQAIAPHWLLANIAGGGTQADPVLIGAGAGFNEFALRPVSGNYTQFEDLASLLTHELALSSPPPYIVLDSYMPSSVSPLDGSAQLTTLAEYYLLADPHSTFLDFYGGSAPATSWQYHWSPAATYNIGQPAGSWSLASTGIDPSNAALTYKVYERQYTNALVLYKPLSYSHGTNGTLGAGGTVFTLGGSYQVLQADGTLGPVVTSITLTNGQGVILVPVNTATPAAAPAASPATAPTSAAAVSTGAAEHGRLPVLRRLLSSRKGHGHRKAAQDAPHVHKGRTR